MWNFTNHTVGIVEGEPVVFLRILRAVVRLACQNLSYAFGFRGGIPRCPRREDYSNRCCPHISRYCNAAEIDDLTSLPVWNRDPVRFSRARIEE